MTTVEGIGSTRTRIHPVQVRRLRRRRRSRTRSAPPTFLCVGADRQDPRLPVRLLHAWDGDVHLRAAEEPAQTHPGGHHPGPGWSVPSLSQSSQVSHFRSLSPVRELKLLVLMKSGSANLQHSHRPLHEGHRAQVLPFRSGKVHVPEGNHQNHT